MILNIPQDWRKTIDKRDTKIVFRPTADEHKIDQLLHAKGSLVRTLGSRMEHFMCVDKKISRFLYGKTLPLGFLE